MTSFTDTTHTVRPRRASAGGRIRSAAARIIRRAALRLRIEWNVRSGAKSLAWLDDRLLADVGVSRRHILLAARHGRIRKEK